MLSSLYLKDFGIFDEIRIDNLANFNVLIGENDTGKTSVLKMAYTTAKTWEEFSLRQLNSSAAVSFKKILADKLRDTFQPQKKGLGDLVNKKKDSKLYCELAFFANEKHAQEIHFSFTKDTESQIQDCSENIKPNEADNNFNALFIPAKEVLTAHNAISSTRDKLFMDGFDDTYLDLIKSLRIKTQKGKVAANLSKASDIIEQLFGGEILQTANDEFIFRKNSKAEFSMQLTAEGVKKLGVLTTLIRNRQLNKGTMLFMDEPETVLHPKAIRELLNVLFLLSQSGVQLFISTHNFFVIKELELIARKSNTTINCCSLIKENDRIIPKLSDLKNGMPSNPIIDAAVAIFEDEVELNFKK